MPTTVHYQGKSGTVHLITGRTAWDIIAEWKTCEITASVTNVEHNGPYDDWEFGTIVRNGLTITADKFVVNSSNLAEILPPLGTVGQAEVLVSTDMAGGTGLHGTFHITNMTLGNSDEASTENITLQSFGSIGLN